MIARGCVVLWLAGLMPVMPGRGLAAQTPQAVMAYAEPSHAGFSEAKLAEIRAFADQSRAAAVVALFRGHLVAAA